MKTCYKIFFTLLLPAHAFSQTAEVNFKKVVDPISSANYVSAIAQDKQGYIWFGSYTKGLNRFDGSKIKTYVNNTRDSNSIAGNLVTAICIDASNKIWVGVWSKGLEMFDPETNIFHHYRSNPKKPGSLISDTITAIIEDKSGNLWIGTNAGLDMLDKKTGKFTHFTHKANDVNSISDNYVNVLYEDRQGVLWVGCGKWANPASTKGGLNRFDKTSGEFTRYMHDPKDPGSIENNNIGAVFEDSKGNFWIGTSGDGLHIMDRKTGLFTHYYYDPKLPEKLSRPPISRNYDQVNFIEEDRKGSIWIGSEYQGINRYDPATAKATHYGFYSDQRYSTPAKDTLSGFTGFGGSSALISGNGILWITTPNGDMFMADLSKSHLPFYPIHANEANALYHEINSDMLWIATSDGGLVRKNLTTQKEDSWINDAKNANSLSSNIVYDIKTTGDGNLWLGTISGGLVKFNIASNKFTTFMHDKEKEGTISSNEINFLFFDENKDLWIAHSQSGIDKMDHTTGTFKNYRNDPGNSFSLINNSAYCISGSSKEIWIATTTGLDKLDTKSNKFQHYLQGVATKTVSIDANKVVWAGAEEGLYFFDKKTNKFQLYSDDNITSIPEVLNILEDDDQNLWISTRNYIVKINKERNGSKTYNEAYGVKANSMGWSSNFKSKDGRLFIGHYTGYYAFHPKQIKEDDSPPDLNFISFKLGDRIVTSEKGSLLEAPIWQTKKLSLKHNQNTFSFDFAAVDYSSSGEIKYHYILENYDKEWRNIETDHRAFFFNVPPGKYNLRIKSISNDGQSSERSIQISITPPWWKTWWAYILYALVFSAAIWSLIAFRSSQLKKENIILESKVLSRTAELNRSLEDLRATQSQLIQSEKMASLGELTAGIAHEIQNPLNFVNNFSDLNKELADELEQEIDKGNYSDAKTIAKDIKENEQKINHHGKRADAIVKGMLQHSRSSSGVKEQTDINSLADEYLRLAYHGLRAKDKSFNVLLKTDYDKNIGNIKIIPQDIGRVLLNLINNAFYAVNERKSLGIDGYEPEVLVSTRKVNNNVEVKVADNGNGISQKILDKIFQPFFTTKPTGQGTGLGLSLSYDIIKAHGGELKVETIEARPDEPVERGRGSVFTFHLPLNSGI